MTLRPGSSNEDADRADPERAGLGPRRVVWSAFGVSVAVHLLAIILYPTIFAEIRSHAPTFLPDDPTPLDALEVIELIEEDPTPEPFEPDDPEEIERLAEPVEEVEPTGLDEIPGIEIVPLPPGVAERLRPRLGDPRLWRDLPPEFYELTLEQREELIVAQRLTAWFDSVQAGLAAEAAATDWTFTDRDGGRWGISPGKLHLGSVTLPLPVNFGIPVGKRDETNALIWQWEEIMRQAARADVELTWRERAEAIRERRDAERAAQSPPDTTRGRGG